MVEKEAKQERLKRLSLLFICERKQAFLFLLLVCNKPHGAILNHIKPRAHALLNITV